MNADLHELIKSDPRYRTLLKVIVETPYIERQALAEAVKIPAEDLEGLLSALTEKLVVLELTSQANSSVESRVPKKVYLVNPELESEVRKLL